MIFSVLVGKNPLDGKFWSSTSAITSPLIYLISITYSTIINKQLIVQTSKTKSLTAVNKANTIRIEEEFLYNVTT